MPPLAARLALLLPLALAAGCSNDLEKQSAVLKLRVLAVQAEPAELVVQLDGGLPRTTLTALAVEPNGAPISTRYALCTVQGLLAADTPCPGDAGIPLPDAGTNGAVLDLSDPAIAALGAELLGGAGGGLDGGTATSFPLQFGLTATAPAGLAPDGGPPPGPGGTQVLEAFGSVPLRLAQSDSPLVNKNPAMTALLADGLELAADGSSTLRAGAKVVLTPVPAADAKEPTATGPERLTFSFFATAGEVDALRATDTTSTGQPGKSTTEYTAPPSGTVRLWVVVKDDRGGTGWIERRVTIAP